MAQELAELIIAGKNADWLEWKEDGSVRVLVGDIFPTGSGFKRTIENRRKRLCDQIGDILVGQGWKEIGWNRFRKEATTHVGE